VSVAATAIAQKVQNEAGGLSAARFAKPFGRWD
jgi:hypothetical protein